MELSSNPLLDGLAELEEISKKWSTVKNSSGYSESHASRRTESLLSKETTPASTKDMRKTEKRAGKSENAETQEVKGEAISRVLSNESELSQKISLADRDQDTKEVRAKVKSHFPQIIDEDTEQFKIKLEHLLNHFKNDAINEFMVMKKGLLEEQVKTIKKETEKYLKMYEQKYEENENNKAALSNKIKENEDLSRIYQNIREKFIKSKQNCTEKIKLSKLFNTWKNLRESKKSKKRTIDFANHFSQFRLMKSQFNIWRSSFLLDKKLRADEALAKEHLLEIEQISTKFNKEIEQLTNKLKEVQSMLDEANNNQLNMQENLKRAFVRGVCALNFEAMNVLQSGKPGSGSDQALLPNQLLSTAETFSQRAENVSMSLASKEYSSLIINPLENKQPSVVAKRNGEKEDDELREENDELVKRKKILIIQNPSLESKEYKWKQAPILGAANNENNCGLITEEEMEREKPFKHNAFSSMGSGFKMSPEILKDTTNTIASSADEKKLMTQTIRKSFVSEEENQDEGKVIKVNNGKSFTANSGAKPNSKAKEDGLASSKTVVGKAIGKSDAKINSIMKTASGIPALEKKSAKIK